MSQRPDTDDAPEQEPNTGIAQEPNTRTQEPNTGAIQEPNTGNFEKSDDNLSAEANEN
jgi:hypothetical protein